MEMNTIETHDNKVLLIAPLFFGYYNEIMIELTNMGYEVTYICDTPSNSNLSKAVGRINKNLIKHSAEVYFKNKVLPLIENLKFSFIFLVAGMTFAFTPEMIQTIRRLNPDAKFVMYQWDSEKNLPYSTYIHAYFDSIFSFDRNDCNTKSIYKFLPLFYTKTYGKIGAEKVDKYIYDCSYIGTAHPKKYYDINCMSISLKDRMPSQFIYHYMPSKLKYIYHKLFAVEYKKARYSDFKTKKLQSNDIMEIILRSKCILDAPQADQIGLTIRTIECLGAKRKLVTTNADVVNYDFYRPSNILVFTEDIDYNSDFFRSDYEEVPEEIYKKYSLHNWLNTIIHI